MAGVVTQMEVCLEKCPDLFMELMHVIEPSYAFPRKVLEKALSRSKSIYRWFDSDGRLGAFFLVNWETMNSRTAVYCGLTVAREDLKGTGVSKHCFDFFLRDVRAWEEAHGERLLLWATTATPSAFNIINSVFADASPDLSGRMDRDLVDVLEEGKHRWGWRCDVNHPFVVKGLVHASDFSEAERSRILRLKDRHDFDHFERWGLKEEEGDRCILTFRAPLTSEDHTSNRS